MSVRFILGRAGSGKTRHFLQQIEQLVRADPFGFPIFWLLPKQATFQAERELTCLLGAFSRVRVVSFDQLGKDILTDCGDVGIPQVTALGRQMVVGRLLRKHQKDLKFYSASARRPGLAAELDRTFGEFERAGVDSTALQSVVDSLEAPSEGATWLADKLHDINLLLHAYNAHIGQDRLDPARRLKLILTRVNSCSMLKRAILFVDDFYDFSGYEQKLLATIAAVSARTEIALLVDPHNPAIRDVAAIHDDLSPFHRTERTYRLLHRAFEQAGVRIEPPLLLQRTFRYESEELRTIERNLFSASALADPSTNPASPSSITFLQAIDRRNEVDAVAREIRKVLRSGVRLRDVAVLARDLSAYEEIIDASFREHQLQYFADRRKGAAHHPLLQFVRACILIALRSWPNDAVMTLLKSGLAGVTEQEAAEIENYVLQHRIHGKMWISEKPWGFRRELTRSDEDPLEVAFTQSSEIDSARQSVIAKLHRFLQEVPPKKSLPFRKIITELFLMLEEFKVRATLAGWMKEAESANRLQERGEHEQVWANLVELFQNMAELLGDENVTLADFLEVLDNGLESFDLALAPPTLDQILVGQIDRTRTPEVKLVFVIGMNEGEFPRLHREEGVLWDSERRVLGNRNIELDPQTDRRLLDERLLAYVAFTRPSQRLIVSRPLANESGRATNTSVFWDELRRLFPHADVQLLARPAENDISSIGTPRQLITTLMRWARGESDPNPICSALYHWLAKHEFCDDAIDVMRFRAWKALGYSNTAHLSPETASRFFASPLQSGISQIETFAACPFQHFMRFGLKLRKREEADVTAMDLGMAYHAVLEDLVGNILRSRQDWCELDPGEMRLLIRTYTAEIGRRLRGELMLSSARNRYMLQRIERTLAQAVETQCEMSRRGKFRPEFAPLKFGQGQPLDAYVVNTPAGNVVQLSGKIDRVDIYNDAFAVADYKSGKGALAIDSVYYGLTLKLLVYLLVVSEGGEKLVGKKLTPAAAFFLQLLREHDKVDHPEDALSPEDPDFPLRDKARGIIDERFTHLIDASTTSSTSSKVANFSLNKDGVLGYRDKSDVAHVDEFHALLQHVRQRIGELTDELIAGDIRIRPYMMARKTPCPHCDFRSICRFEPGSDEYNFLKKMKRQDVLYTVTHGGGHAE